MADLGGYIGDNSGMGQGLAYVLPESRAMQYFVQLANEKANYNRQQIAAQQQARQQQNALYAKHLYDTKTPEYATEFTKSLQPQLQSLTNEMAQYHAETGQDPFSNPQFIAKRNELNNYAQRTTQAHSNYVAARTALQDKAANLTPESVTALQGYVDAYEKDPTTQIDSVLPSVKERGADINDAIKLGTAVSNSTNDGRYDTTVPNRSAHVQQAKAIFSDPQFFPFLQSKGVNPQVGDVFGLPNGKGGTIYPTNAKDINGIADYYISNADKPAVQATFQAAGIDPQDEFAKEKLTTLIQRQNKGYGGVYSQFADTLDAKVKTDNKRVYTAEDQAMQRERLNMGRQRFAERNDDKADTNAPEPTSINIPYKNGDANVTSSQYVPLSLPNKNFASVPAYDLTNGTKVPQLASSGDYEIVGVGNFPFITSDAKDNKGNELKGTIAQGNFAQDNPNAVTQKPMVHVQSKVPGQDIKQDFLIEYDRLPENVKNSKSVQKALANFRPANGQSNNRTTSTKKTIPVTQVRSLVGKKGYEGYTEKELIDYYKSQGYNIQ